MTSLGTRVASMREPRVSYSRINGKAGFMDKKRVTFHMIKDEPIGPIPAYLFKKKSNGTDSKGPITTPDGAEVSSTETGTDIGPIIVA